MINFLAMLIALIGIVLNIEHNWRCFIFWLVSNAYWFVHNIVIGEYVQACMFGIFFGASVFGLMEWRAKENEKPIGW